ncbi:MAG: trypsin-like serine protease [Clostridiales bacterium]|nr:trypsin-like serine protease [Clostridiales bacterium]
MNDKSNDNISGIEAGRSASPQSSEYRYTKEDIPHHSYMDASYAPSGEGPEAPRSYYTPPQKPPAAKKEKEKKANKNIGMVQLICALLICALLGGLGGGAIVSWLDSSQNSGSDAVSQGQVVVTAAPVEQAPTAAPVVTGSILSGSEIYSLGCMQAVAITTEITYTNYFGMQTSMPVSGSGFIATEDGYIVTNYHVIEEAQKGGYDISVVLYSGESYKAKIIGTEEQNDIAVLKIDAKGLSAATLGNSGNMQVGETVYAIGNPLGELSFTMTSGMVSALDREITTSNSNTGATITNNMFQIDAAVNQGNSGGPVYNVRGEVIGIVTAKYTSTGVEGLGFAIPINDVASIVNELTEKGYVSGKPSFGIIATTVEQSIAQYFNMVEGAYIYSINSGSCSENAGLAVGDIITAIDGFEVKSSSALTSQKKKYNAGDTVTLTIYRSGEYLEVDVVLDEEVPASGVSKPEPKPQPSVVPKQ